jgi:general secretion pathway protein E
MSFEELRACEADFSRIAYAEAVRRGGVLVRDAAGKLMAVLADPRDGATQDWMEELVREPFAYRLARVEDIAAFLSGHEAALRAMSGFDAGAEGAGAAREAAQDISIEAIGDADSPVVRLVNSTLHDALKTGASDVHLETTASGLSVKYRIDGVLSGVTAVEGVEFADQVLSRVKVLAELDIAERRIPQDGRFKAANKGREVDFRVSIMPSVFGEDAVLRVLDKRALADQARGLTLDHLGFEADTVKRLRRLAREPHGMLLVTGPTGSGKTTTLYAVISEVNKGTEKIVTIEDPVEYQLPGILQIPVNEKKGLTFARGLRSILRHDPDRIMVGEIRDPETAEIAVQSALTGHLVYTTVHANNVFDVMGRFLHMGVDTFNFTAALNAVMAQRLLRVNCVDCVREDAPSAALLEESAIESADLARYTFRRGTGCARCRGTGFRGRKAVSELLVLDDALRELFVARAPIRRLKEAAHAAGLRTLREAALALVARGETTLEEANHVTSVVR